MGLVAVGFGLYKSLHVGSGPNVIIASLVADLSAGIRRRLALADLQSGMLVCIGPPEELRRTKAPGVTLSAECDPLEDVFVSVAGEVEP